MEIDANDIFLIGEVNLYRQPLDIPFTPENMEAISEPVRAPSGFRNAVKTLLRKEAQYAAEHPVAWNPQFGYVTSIPYRCGTGIEFTAFLHLEGLHLIGDLEPALNALTAMRFNAHGVNGDGIKNAAHIFRLYNATSLGLEEYELAHRVRKVYVGLMQQERNARIRLIEEFPRIFEDSVERSIAILKKCRLLSRTEFLDIISPLRLAANLGFLDNIDRSELAELMFEGALNHTSSPAPSTYEEQKELDRRDAEFADKANKRFRSVRLNNFAKEYLG